MSQEDDFAWLNLEVAFGFHGYREDLKSNLIALLRSKAEIDPVVREEIAQALETEERGRVRLSLHGAGSGKENSVAFALRKRREWMIIGREIERLHDSGFSYQDAKRQVRSVELNDGSFIGLNETQAAEALQFFRAFQFFYSANAELAAAFVKIGLDPVGQLESLFISEELAGLVAKLPQRPLGG